MPSRSPRPRLRLLGVVLLGIGIVLGALGPATAVPVNQSITIPSRATVTFTGHGFGHGIGMSQYGARGAARAGLSSSQILGFYYPGTQQTTAADVWVDVRITKDSDGDVQVAYRNNLQVVDRHTGSRFTVPGGRSSTWRLASWGDRTTLTYWANGRWTNYHWSPGTLEFYADGSPITLLTNNNRTRTQYRGFLKAAVPSPGSWRRETVNSLPLDFYLRGVVPHEMPSSWEPAALQAQAVAARTYAMRLRAQPATSYYHLCDTTSCQVYGGYGAEAQRSSDAIVATSRRILTVNGTPALTQYSSSNGGWSARGSQSYLPAKQDPYDTPAINPNHSWRVSFTDADFERRWPQLGDLTGLTVTDRTGDGKWSGRVNSLTLRGTRGSVTLTGAQVRSSFGLKSTWFAVSAAQR
ncbi:SpoIID/LytB domain-containing protein [Nocardioides zeae]|uniref:SpoIID/LytB domain-containing protein n=1 Tax=Nocardioides imazamoxiresistens TaxID=3231893 RepID=A0ABU3PZ59_9ACTN|nr:SpoIID/LytB domain-containing protein [Nocardioides zeae]MDT9594520.1 SpoIID/LytB domain-containing protein [Nocardioides zeae]